MNAEWGIMSDETRVDCFTKPLTSEVLTAVNISMVVHYVVTPC
jgi:hypothetical protein